MKKYFYPAVFQLEEDDKFTVFFPDVPEAITCGDNLEHAYEMAFDALGLVLSYKEEQQEEIPIPSLFHKVSVKENQTIVLIEFDMLA